MQHALRLFKLASLFVLASVTVQAQERLAITPELVSAAEKEGELTLQYSSPLLQMEGTVADFKKIFPKVKVNLERKSGTSGAFALLQELKSNVNRIDVFQGSDWSVNQDLVAGGAFVALQLANTDEFKKPSPDLTPSVFSPGMHRTVISYNPRFVTEEEAEKLKNWQGVLDPVFRGRISLVEPTFGVTLAPLAYIMKTPGLGEKFLRDLKAQRPLIFDNTAQAREAVVSGQRPISWGAQWEAVILTDIEKTVPVRFVYPNPTPEWGSAGWAVLARAPHPNAARLILAWKMNRDGGMAEQASYSNTRSALKDIEDTRAGIKIVRKEAWFKEPVATWTPPANDLTKDGPAMQEAWMKIMKGD